MKKESYDNHLSFLLTEDCEVVRDKDKDGNDSFSIICGLSYDDEGNKTADCSFKIDAINGNYPKNVDSNIDIQIHGLIKDVQYGFMTLPCAALMARFSYNGYSYSAFATKVTNDADVIADLMKKALNKLINSMEIDGEAVHCKEIPSTVFDKVDNAETEDDAEPEVNVNYQYKDGSSKIFGLFNILLYDVAGKALKNYDYQYDEEKGIISVSAENADMFDVVASTDEIRRLMEISGVDTGSFLISGTEDDGGGRYSAFNVFYKGGECKVRTRDFDVASEKTNMSVFKTAESTAHKELSAEKWQDIDLYEKYISPRRRLFVTNKSDQQQLYSKIDLWVEAEKGNLQDAVKSAELLMTNEDNEVEDSNNNDKKVGKHNRIETIGPEDIEEYFRQHNIPYSEDTYESLTADDIFAIVNGTYDGPKEKTGKSSDSLAQETDSNIYQWKFSECKEAFGKDWSISIPDGFTVLESLEGRDFEAVPSGWENDRQMAPVHIYAGMRVGSQVSGTDEVFHPLAKLGLAETIVTNKASSLGNLFGTTAEVFGVGTEKVCAYAMINDTDNDSYSYQCQVLMGDEEQGIRVQTQTITAENKQQLTESIKRWIGTFTNRANNKKAICCYDSPEIKTDLANGDTSSFKKATDHIQAEYLFSIKGRMAAFQSNSDNGYINGSAKELKAILEDALTLKLFYCQKADALLNGLDFSGISVETIQSIFAILKELGQTITTGKVNGEEAIAEVPKELLQLQKGWEEKEAQLLRNSKAKSKEEADIDAITGDYSPDELNELIKQIPEGELTDLVENGKKIKSVLDASWGNRLKEHEEELNKKEFINSLDVRKEIRSIVNDRDNYAQLYAKLIHQIRINGEKEFNNSPSPDVIGVEAVYNLMKTIKGYIDGWSVLFDLSGDAAEIRNDGTNNYIIDESVTEDLSIWEKLYRSFPEGSSKFMQGQLRLIARSLEKTISASDKEIEKLNKQKSDVDYSINNCETEIKDLSEKLYMKLSEIDDWLSEQKSKIQGSVKDKEQALENTKSELVSAENELAHLSFLKFNRKKELQGIIDQLKWEVSDKERDIESERGKEIEYEKQAEYMKDTEREPLNKQSDRLDELKKQVSELSDKIGRIEDEIFNNRHRISVINESITNLQNGVRDDRVERIISEESQRLVNKSKSRHDTVTAKIKLKPTDSQRQNQMDKERILELLADSYDGLTASEIGNSLGLSLARSTALLTQLCKEGTVEREVIRKIAYFRLA